MISPDDALTLAINLLRDSAETRRMPSGIELEAHVAELHEEAAEELELLRDQFRSAPAGR